MTELAFVVDLAPIADGIECCRVTISSDGKVEVNFGQWEIDSHEAELCE